MVGFRPSGKALKPDFRRINPLSGAKNLFGPNALVETAKSIAKVGVVAAIVAIALLPRLPEFGGMVGISPTDFGSILATDMGSLVKRAAFAYLFIGLADFAWQKRRTEKSMKMDKQEVRDEAKNANLPAEVRSMIRRRQMEASRKRMMANVPTADVVVTNPTHYSVALRYDTGRGRRARGRGQGQGHHRPAHPRAGRRARRAGRPRPAARARALRVGRDRPPDPRGVLRRRGRRPRLRLPHGGPEGCGMTNFFKQASQATRTSSPPAPWCWSS